MLIVLARYTVASGWEETVSVALREMESRSRAEPGCLEYRVYRSVEGPSLFMLFEVYANQAAYDAHRGAAYFRELVEGIIAPHLLAREREYYTPLTPWPD